MHTHNRALALGAILLLPVFAHRAVARHARAAAQPASFTYQGTVRSFTAKTGSLELVTGVGMALRNVRVSVTPAARPAGVDLQPGDIVRVEAHRTAAGLVADRVERVEVAKP